MSDLLKPKILGLRPSMIAYLYWRRLRSHTASELMAGAGIAIGIALFVGVLSASSTLTRAGDELIRGVNGNARLGLAARSLQSGFDERTAQAAGSLAGVKVAAYLLREDVSIRGPRARAPVQLIGVSSNLGELGGSADGESAVEAGVLGGGIALPSTVAKAVGARVGDSVTVFANGEAHSVRLRALLRGTHLSALSVSPVAVALLPVAQRLSGRPRTVSSVLIEPEPGAKQTVQSGLERLAAGRLEVDQAPGKELALLAEATAPSRQSTTLFAAVGAAIGFLLALNAMLLTAPERRRFVVDLKTDGYDWRQVLVVLISQALVLGILASLVGIVAGEALARTLFRPATTGLTTAFPIGIREAVDVRLVAAALVAGMIATLLASLPVIADLGVRRSSDGRAHRVGIEVIGSRVTFALAGVAVVLAAVVTVIMIEVPALTIAGVIVLGGVVPCLMPLAMAAMVRGLDALGQRVPSSSLIVTSHELRGANTRVIVVAAIVGLAVYSTISMTGAQRDLFGGIRQGIVGYFNAAEVWVAPPDNVLNTSSFRAGALPSRIERLSSVASVRAQQGTLLDVGNHRVWIDAHSPTIPSFVPPGQLIHGSLATANSLLRAGGWAAVSTDLAAERHLRIGETLALPTPSGVARLKVAAITTNLAWPAGVIILNTNDYERYWQTSEPTALEINFKPAVNPVAGRRAVASTLRGYPGLSALTSAERVAANEATVHQQLESLTVISTLLLIAAAVAVALALSAAIWQRRVRLAALRIHGYDYRQLWRAVLLENAVVLTIGALIGAVVGLYAHIWVSRWMRIVPGFFAPFSVEGLAVLSTLALMIGVALLVIALPGLAAARVPPRLSFQE